MQSLTYRSAITVRRSFTRVAYCDASLPEELLETLWTRPESLLGQGELMRDAGMRRTVRLQWASQAYVLKYYGELTWRHALKRAVQESRAWATWAATHKLIHAGIATPQPVACVENRWGPVQRESFFMYRYVEGQTLRSHFVGDVNGVPLESLWHQLRDLWQTLRQLRISLWDTHLRNFIVCQAGQVWVIDLDKTRYHRTAYVNAHYQQRAWNRLLRSVATAEKVRAGLIPDKTKLPKKPKR